MHSCFAVFSVLHVFSDVVFECANVCEAYLNLYIYIYTVYVYIYVSISDLMRMFALRCFPPIGFLLHRLLPLFGCVNILWCNMSLACPKMHFVFTCPSNTSEFEASAWLYNLLHDKVQHIGFMQNLGITFCSTVTKRNILLHVKLSPMLNTVKFLGPNLAKPLNMYFPEQ